MFSIDVLLLDSRDLKTVEFAKNAIALGFSYIPILQVRKQAVFRPSSRYHI